jgi:hypothetical protein
MREVKGVPDSDKPTNDGFVNQMLNAAEQYKTAAVDNMTKYQKCLEAVLFAKGVKADQGIDPLSVNPVIMGKPVPRITPKQGQTPTSNPDVQLEGELGKAAISSKRMGNCAASKPRTSAEPVAMSSLDGGDPSLGNPLDLAERLKACEELATLINQGKYDVKPPSGGRKRKSR